MIEYNHAGEGTDAPRTYESAWEWNEDDSKKLRTAEEWLEEEAHVDEKLTHAIPDDFPRAGILRSIAQEIATLRRERTQWAEECTRLASLRGAGSDQPAEKVSAAEELRQDDQRTDLRGAVIDAVRKYYAGERLNGPDPWQALDAYAEFERAAGVRSSGGPTPEEASDA